MVFDESQYDYNNIKKEGTGSTKLEDYKIIDYLFDRYTIKVQVNSKNEFIGIIEVKLNKDFCSYKQQSTPQGFHDIDEFYKE